MQFPEQAQLGNQGPRTKSRTQFGSRRESDVYERGARGDSLGVPPERPVRPRRLQEPAAFPEQGQPVCLAQAGGGGRADRPRDARPGGAHALLARRGQPRVRREARGRRARLPAEASSRRGRGQDEGNRARRGRRRAAHADGLAGLGPGGASGRPRRARPRGRGQARRGPGGVGRPKSTRPWLFDERGEAQGGRGGEEALAGGEARGRDQDPVDPEEHLS